MTALRPMLVMVCEPCRAGDFTAEPGDSDCAFCNAMYGSGLPPEPARTREEIVEATMVAMYGGQTFEYRNDGREPVRRAHALYRAERVLVAAGVIEGEAAWNTCPLHGHYAARNRPGAELVDCPACRAEDASARHVP